MMWKKWIQCGRNMLAELVWPRRHQCLLCGCLSEGELICEACAEQLQLLRAPDGSGHAYWYDGGAAQLVRELKFGCTADCAEVLASGMAEAAASIQLPEDAVLTWVPMPEVRLRERGIDHGRELCTAVAAKLGRPMKPLLERTARKGQTQRGLGRSERLRSLQGAFRALECSGCNVLLVDDVYTTGATYAACREALLAAGAQEVYLLTATVTRPLNEPDGLKEELP